MKTTIVLLVTLQLITISGIAYAGDGPKPTPSLTTTVVNDEGEKLLANSTGQTLYVFDVDQGKETSACNEACAEVWPPVLLTPAEVQNLAAPYGQIVRANKKAQLTYEGRPVYTYAFDRGQGDEAGDGIGGVWHYIELESK